MINQIGKLTNFQVEMLKMFQYNLNEDQLNEIKQMLARYFAETASNEMDKLWEQENWSNETMLQWSKEHLRK